MGIYTTRTTKRGKKPRLENSKNHRHELSSNRESDRQKMKINVVFSHFIMIQKWYGCKYYNVFMPFRRKTRT